MDPPGGSSASAGAAWGAQSASRSGAGGGQFEREAASRSSDPGHFDLAAVGAPVVELVERAERDIEEARARIERQRAEVHTRRAEQQRLREELTTLRADLVARNAATLAARYGFLAQCCMRQPDALEKNARRERRQVIAAFAQESFEQADDNDDRELTLEELRQIEGGNAELVMMEADVNGDGVLSKREYVNYKVFVAKQAGKTARRAFKAANLEGEGGELTLEELRAVEGDNAERVMLEADVDNSGKLSKREYVDYKIRRAAHGANLL